MDFTPLREQEYKYPALVGEPNQQGLLNVSENPSHALHWEEWGNPNGEPIMLVHGGPGGGISHNHARICDPTRYRIILFDQRGCGKSVPHVFDDMPGAMRDNITDATVEDMEKLRAHLDLSDKKMHVYGGSWGSTAALAYAQKYPQHVENLALRGVFLCDRDDLSFFYQGNAATYADNPGDTTLPGAYRAYNSDSEYTIPLQLRDPRMAQAYQAAWHRYVSVIPPQERGDMIAAYHERFNNPKFSAAEREEAALAWSGWEGVTSFLNQDIMDKKFEEPRFTAAFATIENEYFFCSLRGEDPALADLIKPENIARLADIPISIVRGAHDQVCVPLSAHKLRAALQAAGNEPDYQETTAGHALTERPTFAAVTAVIDNLPPMKQNWRSRHEQRAATKQEIAF